MTPASTTALLERWIARTGALLLADICLLCDARGGRLPNLCDACAADLMRLARSAPRSTRARLRIAFSYAPPVSGLIRAFKYRGDLAAGLTLGTLLAEILRQQAAPRPDALIPVPLHPARLRQRGFNQAHELAGTLSAVLGLPLVDDACRRHRVTAPQSEIDSARERFDNVAGAFTASRALPDIRHAVVVDDVVTTGATVRELSRVLRRAGVRRVDVWACARPG